MPLHQTLTGRFVTLEPISETHRDALRAIGNADVETWERLYPVSWAGEHFDRNWANVAQDMSAGRTLAFAVISGGAVVGMTCYISPDEANRSVEIGGTFYAPDHRGGPVNPQAKRLLMEHAFAHGFDRVQLKVDALNARSRAAVLKLGATFEGILRHDRIVWTGRVRDTAFYSVLAGEWPDVRAGVDARLAAFAPP